MKQKLYLNLEKPVSLHPQLVKLFGDINQALFWQQIYYWSDKGQDPDGWIYKNKKELEEETTLSRHQQDRARKKLEERGYLETKIKKANGSPTLHYKVDIGKVRNLLMEKRETYYSISEKLTIPYTENTTENTTYTSKEVGKPIPSSYGNEEINNLIVFLKEELGGSPDGTQKENRQFAHLLLNKIKKDYLGKNPIEIIQFLIQAGLKDNFHGKNLTNFKYLYYNTQKIIQSIKGRGSKVIKI